MAARFQSLFLHPQYCQQQSNIYFQSYFVTHQKAIYF